MCPSDRCFDILRLTAISVWRNHEAAGERVRHGGSMVAPDKLDAKIESGRGSSRREDTFILEIQDGRVDVHPRICTRELGSMHPVRRRASTVENAGRREYERSRTNGRDPRAPTVRRTDRFDQVVCDVSSRLLAGWHNDGIGRRKVLKPELAFEPKSWTHPNACIRRTTQMQLVPRIG
jgi:hypothetical protein